MKMVKFLNISTAGLLVIAGLTYCTWIGNKLYNDIASFNLAEDIYHFYENRNSLFGLNHTGVISDEEYKDIQSELTKEENELRDRLEKAKASGLIDSKTYYVNRNWLNTTRTF